MPRERQQPVRVILIDDHPAIRDGLKVLLEQEQCVVCGEAESIEEVQTLIKHTPADLALLDLSLGDESGLELIHSLRRAGVLILVYSMYEDGKTVERTLNAGADGYVTKREGADILVGGITELLAGRRYVSPRAAKSMGHQGMKVAEEDKETSSGLCALTSRQEEVLEQIARGLSYKDVALVLGISETTVKYHVQEILERLQLENRAQAIAYYSKNRAMLRLM